MGWWGSPGCGCCDACEDCLNYEVGFDGSGTLEAIDWTSQGTVARDSGIVKFTGDNPTSMMDNSTDVNRLTGGVRTTFEFSLRYDEAIMGVEAIMVTSSQGLLIIIVSQTDFKVWNVETDELLYWVYIDLELSTTYTFEICIDDTNDSVHVGIRNIVYANVDVTNDGLDYIAIFANAPGTWIGPIPPSTPGYWETPTEVLLHVDNFRQYDRAENDSACCECQVIPTPNTPPSTTEPCARLVDICGWLDNEIVVDISGFAAGETCCPDLDGTYTLPFIASTPFGCWWNERFECTPFVGSDEHGCCGDTWGDDPDWELSGIYIEVFVNTSGQAFCRIIGSGTGGAVVDPVDNGIEGLNVSIESEEAFDFSSMCGNKDVDDPVSAFPGGTNGGPVTFDLVFNGFTSRVVPESSQGCDYASLEVTATFTQAW